MLYICPTPIGNLEDITLRTLEVLKRADLICCEDTRHSLKLLNHFNIKAKMVSLHEHNEKNRVEYILDLLKEGKELALISDAGMPGISDPGALIIKAVKKENLPYTVLPGPSAAIVAAVSSTLASEGFTFLGFLPRKEKERLKFLESYKENMTALVFYESPHRIKDMVQSLSKVFDGERKLALIREISKKYEECLVTNLEDLKEKLESWDVKGELVLVIEGSAKSEKQELKFQLQDFYDLCLEENIPKKSIAKLANKVYGVSKNQAYEEILQK